MDDVGVSQGSCRSATGVTWGSCRGHAGVLQGSGKGHVGVNSAVCGCAGASTAAVAAEDWRPQGPHLYPDDQDAGCAGGFPQPAWLHLPQA